MLNTENQDYLEELDQAVQKIRDEVRIFIPCDSGRYKHAAAVYGSEAN